MGETSLMKGIVSPLEFPHCQLYPVRESQFVVDVPQVIFHRIFRDAHVLSDFRVSHPCRKQSDHIFLADR